MGKKSAEKIKYSELMESRKRDEEVCFSEWLRSFQGVAEIYLRANTDYDEKVKELLFPDDKSTTMTLDANTQSEIYYAVYGYADVMGQVSFVLGLQTGIKLMQGATNSNYIEELFQKEIIF